MSERTSVDLVSLDHLYSEVQSVPNGTENGVDVESPEPLPPKTCPVCKKDLPPNANMSFHLMLHPWTEKPYACDHCLFVTMIREELTEHCKVEHPPTRKFICAICSREFTNIRSLNKHKPVHALVLPYSCAYCDKGFPEYILWRQHEVAHKSARFQCEHCKVRFTTMTFLNDHCEKGTCQTEALACCHQKFTMRMDYVQHCFDNHRFHKKEEYPCEFCGKIYAFRCHLNVHIKSCRLRTNKSAPKTRVHSFITPVEPESLAEYEKIPQSTLQPKIVESEEGFKRVYKCDICEKEFSSKYWMLHHRQRHLNPQHSKYVCSYCGLKYLSYSAMYYHKKRVHLKCLPFKCTYCPKCFANSQGLRDHITAHTGEQPYACNYCTKKFRNRSSKNEHQRIHTGERPYKCNYCDQTFKRRDAKLSHERRHTGERPFTCRVCDKSFAQDSTWRSHEKKHQPPYSCTSCEQVFTSKEPLIDHKKSHVSGETVTEQVSFKQVGWNQPSNITTDEDGNIYLHY